MAGSGRLFGTAGIRGRYLRKVGPMLAYNVGLALAGYLKGEGSVIVGHDVRTTSPLLASMAASGLMAGGLDAILISTAPLPVTSYSVVKSRSRAGLMVTASHNPPWDNGIKIVDSRGMELTRDEEEMLEKIIEGGLDGYLADWHNVGTLRIEKELVNYYINDVVSRLTVEPRGQLSLSVDCANGAASNVTPIILREIGVGRVFTFNCHQDGHFPGRHPEPRPDILEPVINASATLGSDALFAHDGDADRLALGVPGYGFVKQDLVIALLAMWKLSTRKGGTVVVSVDVGLEVEEVVSELGGNIVRSRLGKIHERLLREPNAVIAAEPWKLIDPEWGVWVDGIYQAALLAHISLSTGKSMKDLLDLLPFYPSIRVSYVFSSETDRDRVYETAAEEISSIMSRNAVRVMPVDGIRIDYEDGSWILLRRSGTEMKIRLYAQARTREALDSLVGKSEDLILRAAKGLGASVASIERHLSLPPGGVSRESRIRSVL
ncbi:MAG: phosphopentomutase/phosphoglucosamine mutase [Aeropyrum sp.]|nr:phosphopentomutase/phosphoglucosamine mutase [Aeropyrum sp.]MCE4616573.1 phosphopentomutase/phosphoglucosamine mutase [Aeropyrum sp.]